MIALKRNTVLTVLGTLAVAAGLIFSLSAQSAVEPERAVCRDSVDRDGVYRVCRGGFVDHRPSGTRITPVQFGRHAVFVRFEGLNKPGIWIRGGSHVDMKISGSDDILRIVFHRQHKQTDADLEFILNPSDEEEITVATTEALSCGDHVVNGGNVNLCKNNTITHGPTDISLHTADTAHGEFVKFDISGALERELWARRGDTLILHKSGDNSKKLYVRVDDIAQSTQIKLALRATGVQVLGTSIERNEETKPVENQSPSCAGNSIGAGYSTFCADDEFIIAGTGVALTVKEATVDGLHAAYHAKGKNMDAYIPTGNKLDVVGDGNKLVTINYEGIRTGRIGGLNVTIGQEALTTGATASRGQVCHESGDPVLSYRGDTMNAKVGYTFQKLEQPFEQTMLIANGDQFKSIRTKAPSCGPQGQAADGIYLWPEPWNTWSNKSQSQKQAWCTENVSCSQNGQSRAVVLSGASCYCPGLY